MADIINNWHWPQYWLIGLVFLTLLTNGALHGKPRNNEATGEPERVNFITALLRCMLWLFFLIAGGFFG